MSHRRLSYTKLTTYSSTSRVMKSGTKHVACGYMETEMQCCTNKFYSKCECIKCVLCSVMAEQRTRHIQHTWYTWEWRCDTSVDIDTNAPATTAFVHIIARSYQIYLLLFIHPLPPSLSLSRTHSLVFEMGFWMNGIERWVVFVGTLHLYARVSSFSQRFLGRRCLAVVYNPNDVTKKKKKHFVRLVDGFPKRGFHLKYCKWIACDVHLLIKEEEEVFRALNCVRTWLSSMHLRKSFAS